jgi:ABC-type polysaccharide/polyol phosphate transport system ATPase subunit
MTGETPLVALIGVSICYRLAKQKIPSLKEYAIHWMKGALAYEQLWALQEVSLTLGRGETMGIVGPNGAGKSTLLKVVSGVLKPTRGSAEVRGRVAPLLAVGTGFDFELTGRENIYLNALLLGRKRREIDERYAEIVEFSGLRDFIHSPIRNYSSGMLARLGFSIITAWIPDILVLDEVLAVGDSQFVSRCMRRIEFLRQQGSAVLLVSHDLEAVRNNCERAIWLDNGCIRAKGVTDEVVHAYVDSIQEYATH